MDNQMVYFKHHCYSSNSVFKVRNVLIIISIILFVGLCYLIYKCIKYRTIFIDIPIKFNKFNKFNKINKINKINSENKRVYEGLDNKIVVLLKTHVWNDNLEKFAIKIKNEILGSEYQSKSRVELFKRGDKVPHHIDFYILMHSDNYNLLNSIKNADLRRYILMYSENDIKKIYKDGFYSMWLSNHWILMWFYKQFKNKYEYYWSIEYDVRISGNSLKIWNYAGTEDFVYPIEPFKNPDWTWKHHYIGGKLTDDTKYYGYLQLARYSKKFLEYLDKHYSEGENGQDEMITFSLFKRGQKDIGLTGSKDLLSKLINNSWSVDNSESDKNKKSLEYSDSEYLTNKKHLRIFHPIK